MSVQPALRQIEITLAEPLYERLAGEAERRDQDISTVIQTALEEYVERFDITRTRTWELCGAFSVAETEPEYIVGTDETGTHVTNYAEHADDVLRKGT